MKTLATLAVAVGVLTAPALGVAQTSDHAVTHAGLVAELARLEQAGYNPHLGNDPHYPDDLQAAEAKIAAQDNMQQASNDTGGMPSVSSEAGSHTSSDLHVPFVGQ
jgi:hypothetical protein